MEAKWKPVGGHIFPNLFFSLVSASPKEQAFRIQDRGAAFEGSTTRWGVNSYEGVCFLFFRLKH